MAGKMRKMKITTKKKIIIAAIMLLVVGLGAMIYINPQKTGKIQIQPQSRGYKLLVDPTFAAPKNVSIHGTGIGEYDSLVITWTPVAGAKGYHIYSTKVVPDTTVTVAWASYDPVKRAFIYQYSFHPKYGDVYIIRQKGSPGYSYLMWDKIKTTGWALDSLGVMTGCRYAMATNDSMDAERFYRVTAWR